MPIYAYKCTTCGKHFEILARMSDPAPVRGEDCISDKCQLEKQMSQVAKAVSADARPTEGTPDSPQETPVKPVHRCGGGCNH